MTILKLVVYNISAVVSCRDWAVLHHKMSTMNEVRDSGRQDSRSTSGQGCWRRSFDYLAAYFTLGNPLKRRQVNEQRRVFSEEPAPTPRVVYRDRSSRFSPSPRISTGSRERQLCIIWYTFGRLADIKTATLIFSVEEMRRRLPPSPHRPCVVVLYCSALLAIVAVFNSTLFASMSLMQCRYLRERLCLTSTARI